MQCLAYYDITIKIFLNIALCTIDIIDLCKEFDFNFVQKIQPNCLPK